MKTPKLNLSPKQQSWKWAISTLGCPELSLEQACQLAVDHGIGGLELRAFEGSINLPDYFEGLGVDEGKLSSTWRNLGLDVKVIDSSARLVGGKPEAWEELWRIARWADQLGIPYVRVFDGGEDQASPSSFDPLLERVSLWKKRKAADQIACNLLVETHWSLIHPETASAFSTETGLYLLWDAFHTWRLNPLPPSAVWRILGPRVRHVHFKDAKKIPGCPQGAIPCTVGQGEFPFNDLFDCLSESAYSGQLCLEWERFWNPGADTLAVNLNNLRACLQVYENPDFPDRGRFR